MGVSIVENTGYLPKNNIEKQILKREFYGHNNVAK
jgi:hypothetical protein